MERKNAFPFGGRKREEGRERELGKISDPYREGGGHCRKEREEEGKKRKKEEERREKESVKQGKS